jgi:hypothetical protein
MSLGLHGLAEIVNETLAWAPRLPLKTSVSGHSVDITRTDSTKVNVVRALNSQGSVSNVLAVGDQGQVGGNDFELLASVRSSLSVDRCSADPTRCWNLEPAPGFGPATLAKYLGNFKARAFGEFCWLP